MMSLFHKKVNHSAILSILLIAGNQVDAKATHNEDFIGSPKITLELPEDLLCQEGWVDVGYDISNIGEIVNVRILRSEPTGMFDQYALKSFEKLKHHILKTKPKDLKGAIYRFTIAAREICNR